MAFDFVAGNPIKSSAKPTSDMVAVSQPITKKRGDFDQHDADVSDADRDLLVDFMMRHNVFDQSNADAFKRTEQEQTAINDALKYYQPQIDEANREDIDAQIAARDNGASVDYDSGITYRGVGASGHSAKGGHSTLAFSDMGHIAIGEKQNRVNDVLADAAKSAGVSLNTMHGIWFVESRFSTIKEVSSTGCSGAFQFTRGTWAEEMLKHGDEIAARLQAKGFTEDAAIALKYHQALVNKDIKVSDAGLQSQRFNGHIAAYASAYYIADIAHRNHIDAGNEKEGGKLYAAYNVGEGSLRQLVNLAEAGNGSNAMDVLGRVARLNPMFYQGGATGSEALANYQAAIDNGNRQYSKAFDSKPIGQAMVQDDHNAAPKAAPAHTDLLSQAADAIRRNMPQFNFNGH